MLTHGSLFAGIGGFDLGFERAGMKTVWQVEIDEYCRKVLERNFPDAERFGDIRECGAHNLKPVDVISGGFPCQDISVAGDGAGISEGTRSGLWIEYARIIRELRPRFVVVENVAALLGRGLGRVLGDLAAIGYDAEWDCLPAYAFGAEHERERIFLVAYPDSSRQLHPQGGKQELWRRTGDGDQKTTPNSVQSGLSLWGQTGTDEANARIFGKGLGFAIGTEMPGLERRGASRWRGNVHGIPRRMDRIKALGNAIVPQIAEWIGRRIIAVNALEGSDTQ
jgi:DNA (cytosine-5)-methyltransferase 1